jgi:hypothetical protein
LLEDESKTRHKEKHGQQHESVSAIEEHA